MSSPVTKPEHVLGITVEDGRQIRRVRVRGIEGREVWNGSRWIPQRVESEKQEEQGSLWS